MDVFVAGGTGFIGQVLCRELTERGHDVTAASRSATRHSVPDGVTPVTVDVTGPPLESAVAGHDAVVNLVALPSHRPPRGTSHEAVHVDGTRNLVAASEAAGVETVVLLSGLGVDAAVQTAYFEAKRTAEAVVTDASLSSVIFRPSVVFGDGCAFLPFLRRITPPGIAPLPAGGRMRIQPLWVGDLVPLLATAIENEAHAGETYRIGGPRELTLADTVQLVCGERVVVPIPRSLAGAGARIAEYVPGIPLGRDQARVFDHHNTTDNADLAAFDVSPDEFRTLESYLATTTTTDFTHSP
jgi:uncharacterized protein YbjT (DUF2867 family)